mmetsp:Transcript_27383/g.31545  ORF Transcript_27383/g.31545 Transcript_27383/m.31545 type:complete len:86 (-) Transcript_27383:319-576(-)
MSTKEWPEKAGYQGMSMHGFGGDLHRASETFSFFDRQGTGVMRRDDLTLALRAAGCLVTEKEAKEMGAKYSPEEELGISETEFLQ